MAKNNNFYVASGGVYPELVGEICENGNITTERLMPTEHKVFANGELMSSVKESVRGSDVFVVQSALQGHNGYSVNDALIDSLSLADSCTRAGARRIIGVYPQFPYDRQDKKSAPREPIMAKLAADQMRAANIDQVVSIDVHAAQVQGFFDGPFTHLTAHDLLRDHAAKLMLGKEASSIVIAPDEGALKNNNKYARELGLGNAIFMPKEREVVSGGNGGVMRINQSYNVQDMDTYLFDDKLDTGNTLITAAEELKDEGARSIVVLATHGLFSNQAASRLKDSVIDKIVVTNTVPQYESKMILQDKLEVISIAQLLGDAISRIANNESVSELFNDKK